MVRRSKKNKLNRYIWLAVLVVFILTLRLVEDVGIDREPSERFTVVKIIDGDTVELAGGDRVRLLAIDTPEKDEPYYNEAKELVRRLALGKEARIEYAHTRRDKYGRLLGYLYIDTIFVNKVIIDSGLGCLYLFKDNDMGREEIKTLFASQRSALSRQAGIWSLEKNLEDHYIVRDNSFRFHRPG